MGSGCPIPGLCPSFRSLQAVPQPFLECTFPKIHKFIPGKTQKSGFTTHKPVQTFPTSLSLPGRTENLPGSGPIVSIPFFSWGVSADLSCLPRNRTQTSPTRMFCEAISIQTNKLASSWEFREALWRGFAVAASHPQAGSQAAAPGLDTQLRRDARDLAPEPHLTLFRGISLQAPPLPS